MQTEYINFQPIHWSCSHAFGGKDNPPELMYTQQTSMMFGMYVDQINVNVYMSSNSQLWLVYSKDEQVPRSRQPKGSYSV